MDQTIIENPEQSGKRSGNRIYFRKIKLSYHNELLITP